MTSQKLKIATWNLNRPKHSTKAKYESTIQTLRDYDADILVLTETNSCIDFGVYGYTSFPSASLFQSLSVAGEEYEEGENRVTIWTKLQGRRRIDMCNSHSAVCVQMVTDWGDLNVYGTVIGIYGKNRIKNERNLTQTDFERTLDVQIADWERLATLGNLCIIGDFNLTLAGGGYYTMKHRQRIIESFRKFGITAPTASLEGNIDHIVLSEQFMHNFDVKFQTWPKDYSDHQGVWLTLKKL